jgi:hypothetical protein
VLAVHLLVETIGNSGSGRLIDDTEDVHHAGDSAHVLGSLPLTSSGENSLVSPRY